MVAQDAQGMLEMRIIGNRSGKKSAERPLLESQGGLKTFRSGQEKRTSSASASQGQFKAKKDGKVNQARGVGSWDGAPYRT